MTTTTTKKTYDWNNQSYADHCAILKIFATYNLISVKFWTFVSPIYSFRRLILEKQFSFLFSNIITYVLEDLQTYSKKHCFPKLQFFSLKLLQIAYGILTI